MSRVSILYGYTRRIRSFVEWGYESLESLYALYRYISLCNLRRLFIRVTSTNLFVFFTDQDPQPEYYYMQVY